MIRCYQNKRHKGCVHFSGPIFAITGTGMAILLHGSVCSLEHSSINDLFCPNLKAIMSDLYYFMCGFTKILRFVSC